MGAGVVPMQFAADGIETDVVEINGASIPMAEKFFDFDAQRSTSRWAMVEKFLNQRIAPTMPFCWMRFWGFLAEPPHDS